MHDSFADIFSDRKSYCQNVVRVQLREYIQKKKIHTVEVALTLGLVILRVDRWGYCINTDLNKHLEFDSAQSQGLCITN